MRRSKEDTNATIRKLQDVARGHFTEYGYAQTSLESIAQEAELTRGALYHHFRSKKELFRTVLEEVQSEVAEHVEQEAANGTDVWEQLHLGCRAFVIAAVAPRNKRILLVDGPAVLGWEAWRSMDERHSMRLLRSQLDMMQQVGALKHGSVRAMTHFLSGALNEMTLWHAQESVQEDQAMSLEETMSTIALFLDGIKQREAK